MAGHIVCGDFTAPSATLSELGANDTNGWRTGLGTMATSSKVLYDNFVFNTDVVFTLALGFGVDTQTFQNSAKGNWDFGHAAVVMTLKEA